jgi:large subunit ribosomal protein L10
MSRKVKEWMVKELAERFSGIDEHGCVMIGFRGLDSTEADRTRGVLLENGTEMMVVRNRLFKLSLEKIGLPELQELLDGPTAVVEGEDAVQAAKAVAEAREEAEQIEVRGGYVEGRVLDAEGVQKLADLPSREVLLTQVLTGMVAPARQFANCMQGALRQLASIFQQMKEKKEEQAESSEQ